MNLPFYGNKAEIIFEGNNACTGDPGKVLTGAPVKVLIDGKAPSTFQGCYYLTRPYNDSSGEWPWQLPAMIRIQHTRQWVEEEWTCTFTEAEPPYDDFRFSIAGSATGKDGEGTAATNFVSPSGRIIIRGGDAEQGGDWHLKRSYQVLKTIVNPGDQVKWKTYSISTDIITPGITGGINPDNSCVLFQGIPNSAHILQLVKTGKKFPAISEIRIYKPFWSE
jgi:hypothetical protein